MESSCALKKAALKICQLCSAPLPMRTVYQGVLLTNSLKSWKLAFLKFSFLILLFTCFMSLQRMNSTIAWSPQPRQPPILMTPISSFTLVSSRSSIESPLVGPSITWLRKLFSMHSRSLLDHLQLAVLLFQQMSGWFKSPSRTSTCDCNASCSCSDLSCDINRFEISLSNKTKKSKDPDILFMRCQLSRLQKGHATDEWFQLSSYIPLKGIDPGSLRVRARYSMEKIMPEEEYSEFKEIILQKELHVVYALSHVCGQDRTLLAGILLKIFLHEKLESLLLRSLNDKEISMEAEATTLFRATTLASTLMEQYMKATATHFVHHALKDCILKIMESKQSCELNPSKLEKNEDVNTNLAHLLSILSELVEKIFMAAEILPP
ncbi:ras GTPase-activating protein 1-like isoform X1 [Centrocercus urophasianus]|uniref:ras GTPase-activating protein 1-like isoform X1 n=1 Tax=Centrocercus urophasianus TaxID=9002 RepID=UPI001C647E01|nr:ras GTPase-activating protein 1-like isoform X1 [Centrocercus urophasianus]